MKLAIQETELKKRAIRNIKKKYRDNWEVLKLLDYHLDAIYEEENKEEYADSELSVAVHCGEW